MPLPLSPHDAANTVRMMRTLHRGAILIVEGDSDARVYRRFVNKRCCKILPVPGKGAAVGAIYILDSAGIKGVLAIVDSDFDRLSAAQALSPNLLLTDCHDLETMIVCSSALGKVLSDFASPEKTELLSRPVRETLLHAALPIGLFRWFCSPGVANLPLKFKDLRYDDFLQKDTLSVDVDKLIQAVARNSRGDNLDPSDANTKIQDLLKAGHDPRQVCSGHDLSQILSIGLRHTFGNDKGRALSPGAVEQSLRLSYEYSEFRKTQLHRSIERWENANSPFRVLP
jgi:hypothetical protein